MPMPRLTGMRPLENGRLALVFWDDVLQDSEVRVYDLWSGFASRRNDPLCSKWFDPEFFRRACIFGECVAWDDFYELPFDELYDGSEKVEEGFWCLI